MLGRRFIVYTEQQSAGQFEAKAITPDRAPVPIVELQIVGFNPIPYRLRPDGKGLIVLEGVLGASQNFSESSWRAATGVS